MIKQKFILGIFLFIFLILILNFANAAISVTRPMNNTNWSGSAYFNVTYLNSTDFYNATNATFYYNLSGVWTLLGSVNCSGGVIAAIGYCNGTLSFPTLEGIFAINATLWNLTAQSNLSASVITYNVTLDSVAPNVSTFYNTISGGNYSGVVTLNVSVSDGRAVDSVYFNITNSSGVQPAGFFVLASGSGGYYNYTLNTSGALPDGLYNITVYANDTKTNNLNNSKKIQVLLDNTPPIATFSCGTPTSQGIGSTTCTCTPSDTASTSGINSGINTLLTSYTASPDTTVVGTYPLTCTFYDYAGNLGSTIANYTVVSPTSGSQNTQTPATNPTQTNTFDKITPGNTSVVGNFTTSIGVQQIQIEVSSEATSVQVTVTKFNANPVPVNITGKIFQYLQIQTQNLITHLSKATIQIKVDKSWVSGNSLTKDDVSLFKYNETSSQWGKLTTTYLNEDSNYYYYNADVQSFSYFAIGSLSSGINQNQSSANTVQGTAVKKDLTWLWIVLVGIVVVVILVISFLLIKRKNY